MFIVRWEGKAPADKAEWVVVLREVLSGELGSYYVRFRRGPRGWRFALDWRPEARTKEEDLVTNTPDSVAFNLFELLLERGKPVDRGWNPAEAVTRSADSTLPLGAGARTPGARPKA